MPVRTSEAVWRGTLSKGKGFVKIGKEKLLRRYSFASRFESGRGTNPEELIGAALAGCFSMAFSMVLEQAGFLAEKIDTSAHVTLDKADQGYKIMSIALDTKAKVEGIDEKLFHEKAEFAKKTCPVSQALTGTNITLTAALVS